MQTQRTGKIMALATQAYAAKTLSRFAPFNAIDADTLGQLAQATRVQHVHRGELIVHRGDRPNGMYLLVEGAVKLFLISSGGAERIVRLVGMGDSFCEESAFSNAPQTLAAQATCDSLVLFVPTQALQAAMQRSSELGEALLTRLSERMSALVVGMEQCEQRSSMQRVAHYLVQHANGDEETPEVQLRTSKQTIASQLNMTPESFSRVLSRFAREGFIRTQGHRAIRLTDYSGLMSLAV